MKTFLFDIGNVLVDFEFQALLQAFGVQSEDGRFPFTERDIEMRDAVETGKISDAEWVAYLNAAKGLNWSPDDLVALWQNLFSWHDEGRKLYDFAVESNARVFTLSNIARHHIDAIERNWAGFFDGADGLLLSYKIGVRKPHPDIYCRALAELGGKPGDIFFIDDLAENIEAAESAGMQGIQFTPENYGEIRAAMERFLK